MVVKARIKTIPQQAVARGPEYNRRLKAAFAARGIEFPFPQITVWAGGGAAARVPAPPPPAS